MVLHNPRHPRVRHCSREHIAQQTAQTGSHHATYLEPGLPAAGEWAGAAHLSPAAGVRELVTSSSSVSRPSPYRSGLAHADPAPRPECMRSRAQRVQAHNKCPYVHTHRTSHTAHRTPHTAHRKPHPSPTGHEGQPQRASYDPAHTFYNYNNQQASGNSVHCWQPRSSLDYPQALAPTPHFPRQSYAM